MKRMTLFLGGLALLGVGCAGQVPDLTSQVPDGSSATPGTVLEISPAPEEEVVEGVKKVDMEATDFAFSPQTITVSAGQEVEITFVKNGGVHTFVIDELNLRQRVSKDTPIRFNAPEKPGQYAFYCDVGNHRELGMQGVLIVR